MKAGSVVKVGTFSIGLKCRGEILVCVHSTALEDFIKFEVALA